MSKAIEARLDAVFAHAAPVEMALPDPTWAKKNWRYLPMAYFSKGLGQNDGSWGVWDAKEESFIETQMLLRIPLVDLANELLDEVPS